MYRTLHLSALIEGIDIYANHSPYYDIPYWLLTPEQVAYLAGSLARVPVSIERATTRGSGDIITFRVADSVVVVRYSPITDDRAWLDPDTDHRIHASEIVGYVTRGLGLEPPVEGATRDPAGVWHHPQITDADNRGTDQKHE